MNKAIPDGDYLYMPGSPAEQFGSASQSKSVYQAYQNN